MVAKKPRTSAIAKEAMMSEYRRERYWWIREHDGSLRSASIEKDLLRPALGFLVLTLVAVAPSLAAQTPRGGAWVQVDHEHDAVIVTAGPFNLPAGMADMPADMMMDASLPVARFSWPFRTWLRGVQLQLLDSHGRLLSRRLVHHFTIENFDRRDLIYPVPERLMSLGQETADVSIPRTVGVPMRAGQRLGLWVMWNNRTPSEIDGVYARLTLRYIAPDQQPPPLAVLPFHVDANLQVGGHNTFDVPPGGVVRTFDFTIPTSGHLNVVRALLKVGKTWKSYAEDIPGVAYTGPDVGKYARRHNTLALVSDVASDPTQVKNLVPFSQFATDLTNNALPNYAFIVPNVCNDAHDCALGTADAWLKMHIDPLIKSAQFQMDGLLIIVFDESGNDNAHGGGRVVWLAVSAKVKRGYHSTTLYQHESTLRLTLSALGLKTFPNRAATAPDMDEFFTP